MIYLTKETVGWETNFNFVFSSNFFMAEVGNFFLWRILSLDLRVSCFGGEPFSWLLRWKSYCLLIRCLLGPWNGHRWDSPVGSTLHHIILRFQSSQFTQLCINLPPYLFFPTKHTWLETLKANPDGIGGCCVSQGPGTALAFWSICIFNFKLLPLAYLTSS